MSYFPTYDDIFPVYKEPLYKEPSFEPWLTEDGEMDEAPRLWDDEEDE